MPPTVMEQRLKSKQEGVRGLTRSPVVVRVSVHKDAVKLIIHGYFQNKFRVSVYEEVGRPTHDSKEREEALGKVTKTFMVGRVGTVGTTKPSEVIVRAQCLTILL